MASAGLLFAIPLAFLPPQGDAASGQRGDRAATSETRALAFLSREVPAWSRQNGCFSCHNNGDAARALYRAVRSGRDFEQSVLADTSGWLSQPAGWKDNGGEAAFSDKKLARIQFAAALAEAVESRLAKDKAALTRAAAMVAADQDADGSWTVSPESPLGSPTTWGTTLATVLSRRTLLAADGKRFRPAIDRATGWLARQRPRTVLDAAAVLLGPQDERTGQQREHCLQIIRRGEAEAGGWGPYVTSAPEPFDTAVVLLALDRLSGKQDEDVRGLIRHGRRRLIAMQLDDGSWPETTRPPGAESYAQRMSTAGWATMALLATRSRPQDR